MCYEYDSFLLCLVAGTIDGLLVVKLHARCSPPFVGAAVHMGMTGREEQNPLLESPSHDEDEGQEEKEDDSAQEGLVSRTLSESKELWRVAGPSVFSRLALYSITVVTQAFAGHLGDIDLAAISIATTVIISISFGLLVCGLFAFLLTLFSSVAEFVMGGWNEVFGL